MGKKNKYKPKPEGAGGDDGGAGPSGTQQQPAPSQAAVPQQARQQPQQQQGGAGGGWPAQQQQRPQQQQQQRPQQQQQQRPQQQQQGAGGDGWQQQQRPQQQQQQRPQQQQQQRPQQQQQQRPQQQQQQYPQQQQQGAGGSGWQQQQRPQQQQQQRPQQQQQQRPQQQQQQYPQQQQQGAGGSGWQQQQRPQQQQQQRPQQQQQQRPQQQQQQYPQQQQQQRPQQQQQQQHYPQQQQHQQRPQQQQQQYPQQQQQQRPQQQQQRPQQQQQRQPQHQGPRQQQGQASVSHSSSSVSLASTTSTGSIKRGTAGRPGQVEVNYLELDLLNMPDVAYHYDVTMDPDRPKKFIRNAFSKFVQDFLGGIPCAYDGKKSCYTVKRLEHERYEGEVELDDTGGRKIKFKVVLKETDTIEVDLGSLKVYQKERIYDKPMRALQCLEVALANACHNKGVNAGRSFFVQPRQKMDLKDGYELWTGLFQAAILGERPFVNVDISHKSFPSECSLIDWLKMNNIDINRPLEYRAMGNLRTFLKGMQIVYKPPVSFGAMPKSYTVNDVLQEPANKLSFMLEDGRRMTVFDYFKSRNYTLRFPHLNCLHLGSRVRNNYMPIELCYVPSGQALNKKDNKQQVQEMIRFAATSTNRRKEKIMELLNYFAHNQDSLIGKFGIRLGSEFIRVPMRLLYAPQIEYFNRELMKVQNGSWRLNLTTKFLATSKPQSSHKWAVIYSRRSRMTVHTVQKFASMLSDAAKKLGMGLADRPEIRDFEGIDKMLQSMKIENFNLVIVILPASGNPYAETKQNAELKCGILTQCIKEVTVERRLDHQLVLNLLLKINAKLNGTNHKIAEDPQLRMQNVMYIGADVTHPSPDQRQLPSVVGVAASHDAHGACYNMQYRLQRSTLEEIEDMGSIFTHHLKVYHAHQKKYPDYVMYYRDGVSDGQFPKIRDQELAAMRAACKKLQISPKFTCTIVVKRHHTRFFPETEADRFNKFNNVPPGTVVDRVIVHPNEIQFFMVSHQSIQGTAKPTRYNVIVDDAKLDIDVMQKLTNNLCHMFPRCNRAVSYPAPAYLAHLAAFRGRVYLEGTNSFRDLREEYNRRLVNPGFMTSNPMYFV